MWLIAIVVALGLTLSPLVGEAQQAPSVWRIGFVSPYSAHLDKGWRASFQHGLRALGYVEGKNLIIEQRHAEGRLERLPELSAQLVRLKIDLFVAHGSAAIAAAAKASSTIPIVMAAAADPVGTG